MPRLGLLTLALLLAAFGISLAGTGPAEAGQVSIAKQLTKEEILAGGARVIKIDCRKLGHRNKKGVRCTWFSAELVGATKTRNCKGSSDLKPQAKRVRFKTDRCSTDKGATSMNSLLPAKLLKAGFESTYVFCFTTLGHGYKCLWNALRYRAAQIEDCRGKARTSKGNTKIKVKECTRNPVASEAQAAVKRLLLAQGLTPGLVSCRAGATIDCGYEASRRSAGWTYSCTGTATAPSQAGPFDLSRCYLGAPKLAPLTADRGPHPAFGVNEDWGRYLPQLKTLSRDFGAETSRMFVFWARVQPREDAPYDFSYSDAIYASMIRNGINPVVPIMGAPCWATGDPNCRSGDGTYPPDSEHLDDWGRFAAAVANRYPNAMAVEVWNEANARLFFHGGPQPSWYAELLKAAYTSIKAVNAGMPVITTGTAAFVDNDRSRQRYDDFLRKVYLALGPGAKNYSDGIGHHAYPGGGPAADIETGIRGQIADLKDVMLDFDDQDKPIWITETGVSAAGANPYTEAQQAKAYARIYKQFRRIPGIPTVIVHRWRNQPGPARNPETGFGLTRANGSRKPVYCSLVAARGYPKPNRGCR